MGGILGSPKGVSRQDSTDLPGVTGRVLGDRPLSARSLFHNLPSGPPGGIFQDDAFL